MTNAEKKKEFVRLRAEGQSYSQICEQLHVSKATCTKWQQELEENITELKRENLQELYESYGMVKEARIRNLGETLKKIDSALQDADLSTVDPAKLMELKLKYAEAMRGEYTGTVASKKVEATPKGVLAAMADLLGRVQAGEITEEQAKRESAMLQNMLKAIDAVELQRKIDQIEAALETGESGVVILPELLRTEEE